jgi:hypothetical protein
MLLLWPWKERKFTLNHHLWDEKEKNAWSRRTLHAVWKGRHQSHTGNGGFGLLQTLSILFTLVNGFGSH